MRDAALRIVYTKLVSAVVGLGPVVAILGAAAWVYASFWLQLSEAAESYRLQIRKFGWIAENADRLTLELAAAEHTLDPGMAQGSDDSDPDLATGLQSKLKALLDAASLQIASIQATPVRNENGVRFLSVRAQAKGSFEGIVGFLRSLEGASPPNLIDTLDLMPDPSQQDGARISPSFNCIAQLEVVHLIAVDR